MADYTARATVKEYVGIPDATTTDDDQIDAAISAAESRIDKYTGRTFVVPTGTSTRSVRPWSSATVISPAEIAQTTGLAVAVDTTDDGTFDTALTSADWFVGPGDVAPFTELTRFNGRWPTPASGRATVEITAWFGYGMAVPAAVTQAATMMAARLYLRHASPLGFESGSSEFGPVRVGRVDPDIAALLVGYRILAVA